MSTFAQILQLNCGGQPVRWIDHEDAASLYAKNLVLWDLGEEDVLLRGGTNRLSGEQTRLLIRPIVAVRSQSGRAHEVHSIYTRLTNANLFNRDHFMCGYCGKIFGRNSLTRDHVIPKSQGGPDVWMNVVSACLPCNNKKGARTPEQANMPLLYVPYRPTHAENLILSNRHILASQMDFLKAFVGEKSRVFNTTSIN